MQIRGKHWEHKNKTTKCLPPGTNQEIKEAMVLKRFYLCCVMLNAMYLALFHSKQTSSSVILFINTWWHHWFDFWLLLWDINWNLILILKRITKQFDFVLNSHIGPRECSCSFWCCYVQVRSWNCKYFWREDTAREWENY